MNYFILTCMLLATVQAWAGESPVKNRSFDFNGQVQYAVPADWQAMEERSPDYADQGARFTKGLESIRVRLLGGKGSRYAGPADYLKGFEATTMGKPAEKLRQAKVAGIKLWIYRHGYPINLGDPHVMTPGPPRLATEEFCIIPFGKKFFVLSFARESPLPDPKSEGEKTWQKLLNTFSLKKK